jgi:hypothetical protein
MRPSTGRARSWAWPWGVEFARGRARPPKNSTRARWRLPQPGVSGSAVGRAGAAGHASPGAPMLLLEFRAVARGLSAFSLRGCFLHGLNSLFSNGLDVFARRRLIFPLAGCPARVGPLSGPDSLGRSGARGLRGRGSLREASRAVESLDGEAERAPRGGYTRDFTRLFPRPSPGDPHERIAGTNGGF